MTSESARDTTRAFLPGVLLIAVAAMGFSGCGPAPGPDRPSTTMIGLDGTDWRNALPLVRQGKLPVIAALARAGSASTMLTNPDYRWSPVLWTTVATGKVPEKHGVTHFMTAIPGMTKRIPTPSTERRCRALWNIFSERDRTVGFVGWWVTWPAEPVNGVMVTDHFSVSRFDLERDYELGLKDPRYHTAQTYPEGLLAEIDSLKVPRSAIGRDDFSRFADLPVDWEFPERFRIFDPASEFAIAHAVDRSHFGAAEKLLSERQPELFGVFLQGIDILQHYFWEYMDPEGTGTDPSATDRAAFGESIERYYRYADLLVGQLVQAGGDGRAVILVSDHGFRPSTERWAEKNISGEHRRQAFFVAAGPGFRRADPAGSPIPAAGVDAIDVAPTILAYHGLPVAHDMDGEALVEIFESSVRARMPEPIDTYETGPFPRGTLPEHSVSDDLRDRIQALGYIDGTD